jgi:CheY-like chemotaxis protein
MTPVGKCILIADDEESMRKVLAQRLAFWGYTVISAKDGQEAVELAKTRRPDLILLDIMMPVLDGLEACRQLKTTPETQRIPVVFVTAKASKDVPVRARQVGADGLLQKPYDFDELSQVIQRLTTEQI